MRYLHCGDVLAGEGVGRVADEQACFTHSPGIRNERKRVIWEITDIELAAAPTLGMLFTVCSSVELKRGKLYKTALMFCRDLG